MKINFKPGLKSLICTVVMLVIVSFLSGCSSVNSFGSIMTGAVYKSNQGVHETLPSDKYDPYISDISGTAYGWKFLCFIPISTPDSGKALDEIWRKSEIPITDRKNKTIINMTERWGTYWSCFIIGQNYITITGDIVEIKNDQN